MKKVLRKTGMQLSVPANEKWQLVIRMALAGAGALLGLSIDVLDDLHMAADEACDCLLHQKHAIEQIDLYCYKADDQLHTIFTGKRTEQCQDIGQPDVDMVTAILETLSVAAHIKQDSCGIWEIEIILPIDQS